MKCFSCWRKLKKLGDHGDGYSLAYTFDKRYICLNCYNSFHDYIWRDIRGKKKSFGLFYLPGYTR